MKRCFFIVALCVFYLESRNTIPATMKAITLNGLGSTRVLEIREGPLPTASESQMLVKVKAAGINPVDVHMRSGKYPLVKHLPPILGKEVAGIVEQVPPSVTQFQVGDRVFCVLEMGGYAEYVAVDAYDCYPLDDRLTFSQGAAIYITYFTACRALQKASVQQNETVLVHGCSGSLGTAAIQLAKAMGAFVVATVGSPTLEKLAKNVGVDYVTYHTADDHLQQITENVGIVGFDVILEVLGNVNLPMNKKYLKPNGRIIVVGNRAALTIDGQDLYVENGTLHSIALFNFMRADQEAAANFVLKCIENNLLTPLVGQEYTMDQAPRAHFDMVRYKGARGKLVFVM